MSQILTAWILPIIAIISMIAGVILFYTKGNKKQDLAIVEIKTLMKVVRNDILLIKENHLAHIERDIKKISEEMIEVRTQFKDHVKNHK